MHTATESYNVFSKAFWQEFVLRCWLRKRCIIALLLWIFKSTESKPKGKLVQPHQRNQRWSKKKKRKKKTCKGCQRNKESSPRLNEIGNANTKSASWLCHAAIMIPHTELYQFQTISDRCLLRLSGQRPRLSSQRDISFRFVSAIVARHGLLAGVFIFKVCLKRLRQKTQTPQLVYFLSLNMFETWWIQRPKVGKRIILNSFSHIPCR